MSRCKCAHCNAPETEEDEYCDSPGRSGCGACPGCEAWADEEFERKRDEKMEEEV